MNAVIVSDVDEKLPESFMKSWLKDASQHFIDKKLISPEQKALEVSLVFLKEGEAKRLNWKYRGKDYPTDILSFENEDQESLGELVFCWTVLQRQAKEHKMTLEQELGYLMIHGLLHLLGHDHEVPGPQAEKMLGLQDEIFEQMVRKVKKQSQKQSQNHSQKTTGPRLVTKSEKPEKIEKVITLTKVAKATKVAIVTKTAKATKTSKSTKVLKGAKPAPSRSQNALKAVKAKKR
jgi:probable rRNA maturation factor